MQLKDSSSGGSLEIFSHFCCYFPPISDGPALYGTDRPGAGGRIEIFLGSFDFSRKTLLIVGALQCIMHIV